MLRIIVLFGAVLALQRKGVGAQTVEENTMLTTDREIIQDASQSPTLSLSETTIAMDTSTLTAAATSTATLTQSAVLERTRACKLLIGIDEPLYDRMDQNMSKLMILAQDHVDRVNQIFARQVFTDDHSLDDVYFVVGRIQVMFGSCDGFQETNCTSQRDKYLKYFDRYDFSDFCLAYMFTYLDFHNGTAGYAYKGTACRSNQNSGFITLLNYGIEYPIETSAEVFAHELGHSFGSDHDDETDDEECKQGYLMTAVFEDIPDNEANSDKFSKCSIREMNEKVLSKLGDEINDCFVYLEYNPKHEPEVALCGNQILEPGEECDCGMNITHCNDECCFPAHISPEDRELNQTAIPCSRNQRHKCLYPTGLVYGVYIPLVFIFSAAIMIGCALRLDWNGQKKLFTHVTQRNVRVIR